MEMKLNFRILALLFFTILLYQLKIDASNSKQHRIIISTDIGGTDPDDFQSMVHLFLYADTFDIEGIISSPHGLGRKSHILEVIDAYEKDYSSIRLYSKKYPSPDSLRIITKQGETEIATPIGYRESTEGSNWLIECAKRNDPRPLNVLVWGSIEDLAQALHDAPEIEAKLRVYWIGGPNKKWSVNAYQYIAENFPNLWIIESNATYRGWFTGGNTSKWGSNSSFVANYIKSFGALGALFSAKKNEIKMGDTPSLMRLFNGNSENPSQPSWGGQYVRAWDRPHYIYSRLTTENDKMEEFGVLDLRLSFDTTLVTNPYATLKIDRDIEGMIIGDTVRFLFSPKNASTFKYTISSNIATLKGKAGSITSFATPSSNKHNSSQLYTNWWVDDPSVEFKEGSNIGAKTVNMWRDDFLADFAHRMKRCVQPTEVNYFLLQTESANGEIIIDIIDSSYLEGSQVTLTAIPNDGYKFTRWSGDANGTVSTLVLNMNSDKLIIAEFELIAGISDFKTKGVLVYPTIFNDYITISNINRSKSPIYLELYNVNGELLYNLELIPERGECLLDLRSLSPGKYVANIKYDSIVVNRTLVKTH